MSTEAFDPSKFGSGAVIVPKTEIDTRQFDPGAIKAEIAAIKQAEIDLRTAPLGPLNTWSMSRLLDFGSCEYKVYLSRVKKMPDPSGPAAERGTQIHDHIENYIRGDHDKVIKEMRGFIKLIDLLRDEYVEGRVEMEGDWAFTRDWVTTGWAVDDTWARFKLDAYHQQDATSAAIYDWKTGRKFGNEMKHAEQAFGYAVASFARFPELEYVSTKMVYLDQNTDMIGSYTRKQVDMLRPSLEKRADIMTTATEFNPRPSFHACRWCPHAKVQEGYDHPACAFADEQVTR